MGDAGQRPILRSVKVILKFSIECCYIAVYQSSPFFIQNYLIHLFRIETVLIFLKKKILNQFNLFQKSIDYFLHNYINMQ